METSPDKPTENQGLNGTEKGKAAIKSQFLTTKEKFHHFLDNEGKGLSGEKVGDDSVGGEQSEETEEPSEKKMKLDEDETEKSGKPDGKRLRGQNKSRPHMKPTSYDERRLCPSIIQEREIKCVYGDKCKFFHDIAAYMAAKPADVSDRCYLYDTLGKCQYGLSCRFAKAHTGPDLKNLVNEERVKALEGRTLVKNTLDKDLQWQLRKRKVSFKMSEEYLKTIFKAGNRGGDSGKKGAVEKKQGNGSCCAAEDSTPAVEEPDCPATQQPAEESAVKPAAVKTVGPLTDADMIKLRPSEKKQVDFKDKLYLAPLTTCGNLPFRRVCKRFGADITCGEMAMCTNLLQGQSSEWALLKRHESEDLFGVQLEGCFPDTMTRCAELLNNNIDVDFVDINSGCPIDLVYKKGGGCGLMTRTNKFEQIIRGMNYVLDVPLTVKIRTGVQEKSSIAHKLIPEMKTWGVSMITLHGRSREQRYTKMADWDYINTCSKIASPIPLFGNGDILSYEDAMKARETGVSGIMLARGALIKPWIFTEIKERRDWDISSAERLDVLRDFSNYGLEHWGSDTQGLEKTRNFLLEWLSFMCRYIPVGLLERVPQKINERPPFYLGRDYLESLMASQHVGDWVKISEMLLGPVPKNFNFLPKHKANAYK
ncbi:tRNA-dihydrouridine(47) synthase [NAD(P)(+)]-like [Hypomesus transpacificus]|uniref:tRNA-dihydrouridine(47) synthase [NAD(P)(+)]-like n=1 Tax=Hypomesus transpacificus TaxID=137520 RepID=UPI001F08254D|nr:tRNA-dihydrouridine(47) synthase [NAD(P)(+)]-like [Hypomesus transpacificus]XP_046875037.1 tRNA-dihydrouridine(47) synthase [NAD(P)(+)]-like [Hypomesus transpacificus]XP_046875038.1 tRNA-dihydrouridine(47) synthase [NAD(P)(+)]-like [Hypomesus transpacificus]XP_046875039.1 tRNA-dihydrouridine(47) synthase [NAD(P)(+)]-like [Hypomesus transpacificus]XP_046875040.1 tRNA-dihydrouridine(47) synthase [NAD(P)(+)]-like [Hypomesus transpacificus]